MKLLNEWEISEWAFYECLKEDDESLCKLIKKPVMLYAYCMYVKCRPYIRKKIPNDLWLHFKRRTANIKGKIYISTGKGENNKWFVIDESLIKKRNSKCG